MGFGEDQPGTLGTDGRATPEATLEVSLTDSDDSQRVLIGQTVKDGTTRYGLIDGRSSVVELPAAISDIVATALDALAASSEESAAWAATPSG